MASKSFTARPMGEDPGIDDLFAAINAAKAKEPPVLEREEEIPSALSEDKVSEVTPEVREVNPSQADIQPSNEPQNNPSVPQKKRQLKPASEEEEDMQMLTVKIPRKVFLDVESRLLTAKRARFNRPGVSGYTEKFTKTCLMQDSLYTFAYGADVMCSAGHRFVIPYPAEDVENDTVYCPCCGEMMSLSERTGFFFDKKR